MPLSMCRIGSTVVVKDLSVDEALTKIQTELGADPSIQTLIAFAKHTQRGLIR